MDSRKVIKFLRRTLISFCLFFFIAFPFKHLDFLIPGVTEIRPENVIPPVMGILFGVPGALGAALGNIAGDLIDGTTVYTFCFGFLANFLYAYLAHKMWYTWFEREGTVNYPQIYSFYTCVKFITIIFVDSVFVAFMIMLLSEAIGMAKAHDVALILFYNNFDFAVILGLPILATVSNFWNDYEVPPKREISGKWQVPDRVFTLIPAVVLTLGFWYFAYSKLQDEMYPQLAAVIMYIIMILLVIYCFRPRTAEIEKEKKRVDFSLKAKSNILFQVVGILMVVFVVAVTWYLNTKNTQISRLELWQDIFSIAGLSFNFVFGIILASLFIVEKYLANPIEKMTDIVREYGHQDHLDHQGNKAMAAACRSIRSKDEIGELADGIAEMIEDVESYVNNLQAVTQEKQRISTELNLARRIQESFLPRVFPPFPEYTQYFDLYASMDAAKEVGGDFYDFFLTDEDHLGLVIADVSGKGIGASLFMMISKALIKNQAMNAESPAAALEAVNRQICANNEADMFVTVWLGILELSTGRLIAANAGHEYPALMRRDGSFELFKDKHGFVIGGMDGVKFKNYELTLEPGDRLFVYTDGVAEATDAVNEQFGTDRMLTALNQHKLESCMDLISGVRDAIEEFVNGAPQFDDITMLTITFRPAELLRSSEENKE